jgi:hypothetical protein
MTGGLAVRIEVDGMAATTEQLRAAVLADYGHFTAMQVRVGRVCARVQRQDHVIDLGQPSLLPTDSSVTSVSQAPAHTEN